MATTQKILNYFIEETDFGYALKGNREFSGITTISYFETKNEAELELNKLTSVKVTNFENVKINDQVSFEENGNIKIGKVIKVEEKIFTISLPSSWNKNGVIEYYERNFNFFKSGKKTNRFHTNGNAIEIM